MCTAQNCVMICMKNINNCTSSHVHFRVAPKFVRKGVVVSLVRAVSRKGVGGVQMKGLLGHALQISTCEHAFFSIFRSATPGSNILYPKLCASLAKRKSEAAPLPTLRGTNYTTDALHDGNTDSNVSYELMASGYFRVQKRSARTILQIRARTYTL